MMSHQNLSRSLPFKEPDPITVTPWGASWIRLEGDVGLVSQTLRRIRDDGRLDSRYIPAFEDLSHGRVRTVVKLVTAQPVMPVTPRSVPRRQVALVVLVIAAVIALVLGVISAISALISVVTSLLSVLLFIVVLAVVIRFVYDTKSKTSKIQKVPVKDQKITAQRTPKVRKTPGQPRSRSVSTAQRATTGQEAPDDLTERWIAAMQDSRNAQAYGGLDGYVYYDHELGVVQGDPDAHCAAGWLLEVNGDRDFKRSTRTMTKRYGKRLLCRVAKMNDRGYHSRRSRHTCDGTHGHECEWYGPRRRDDHDASHRQRGSTGAPDA